MQGVNGVELLPSEYNYLMDMASAETFRFEAEIIDEKDSIRRERDVEDKLIKPLLKKLGYRENDCTQQLYLEIGNHNHALIPDFVLLPQYYAGHTSAFAVLEAKKTISNQTQLEEAKEQARSYAKLLNANYSVIASQEKVWVTSRQDDYSDDLFSATWQELTQPDMIFALEKLIGKDRAK